MPCIFLKRLKAIYNLVLTRVSVIVKKGVFPFISDIWIQYKNIRESQNNIRLSNNALKYYINRNIHKLLSSITHSLTNGKAEGMNSIHDLRAMDGSDLCT